MFKIDFMPQQSENVSFEMGNGDPSETTMMCVNYAYDWMVAKTGFKAADQCTVIVHVDPRAIQFHGEGTNAFCCKDEEDESVIHVVLNEDVNSFNSSMIASHEAIHAFQYAVGILANGEDANSYYWMGELETKVDYYSQAPEKQAHRFQSMAAMDFHTEVIAPMQDDASDND